MKFATQRNTDNGVKFLFYTKTPKGKELTVPVIAEDEEAAWAKFDRTYGPNTVVEKVRMAGARFSPTKG